MSPRGPARVRPRRLRIAYVTASLNTGGAERQMLLLAEGLPRDEFEVDFICLQARGTHAERAQAAGARVHALSFRGRRGAGPGFLVGLVWNVLLYVRLTAWRYDIVDAWLFNAYALAAVTRPLTWPRALLAGRRSLSGYKAEFNAFQRAGEGLAARAADLVVANSEAVMADAVRLEGLDPRRVRVIHNAAVPAAELSSEDRRHRRAAWGARDETLVIGCVANYKPAKGLELLVAAFADLVGQRPGSDVRLVLVGEGPLRAELDALRRDLGLGSAVVLHGAELEARAVYGAFDLFAFASEAEGFPNVVLEAAAAGLPIVATAVGGTTEIVDDGVTGRLVPVGDRAALARTLGELFDSPDARRRLGAGAAAEVQRRYGGPRMVGEFAALYREMAARPRRPWGRR